MAVMSYVRMSSVEIMSFKPASVSSVTTAITTMTTAVMHSVRPNSVEMALSRLVSSVMTGTLRITMVVMLSV